MSTLIDVVIQGKNKVIVTKHLRVLCTATHVPDIGMHSIVIKSHII